MEALTEFLANVTSVFTAVITNIVSAAQKFLAEPGIAVMLFIMPIVGMTLGYMLKVIGRRRGRGRR